MMPPMKLRMMDSKRNWRRILPDEAPTALRMPISRVRSETETSMIFMMPTPPTMREMEATRVSMLEMMERSEPAGWKLLLPVRTWKVVSPFLEFVSLVLISSATLSVESVVVVRTLICWI